MKNETKGIAPLIIAVVVIVVAAGAGVGIYVVATRGSSGGSGGTGGDVGTATSLSFTVTDTVSGVSGVSGTFMAKDIGTSDLKIRFEGTYGGQTVIEIVNGETQAMWVYAADQWIDMSSYYSTYAGTWSTMFSGYQTDLGSWTGGDITVGTTTISNIQVNPTLADSLFTH